MGHTVSSSCPGTSFGDERTTDLDFTDYAVIFAETMEVLVVSLDVLSKESESLGLWISWAKKKIQNFIQTVDQVSSVSCCREDVDVVEHLPYLGCQITPARKFKREFNRRVGLMEHVLAGAASVALEVLVPRD